MTSRPWYAFYPGDYHRKTAHLTMLQHGAYHLLLGHYYSSGKPLPANAEQLQRICMAFADAERDAIAYIVKHFFVRDGDVLRNPRADEELEKASEISKKRAKAAKTRYANAGANTPANREQLHTQSQSQSQLQSQDTVTATTTLGRKANGSGGKASAHDRHFEGMSLAIDELGKRRR